jgi:hypothetical protein
MIELLTQRPPPDAMDRMTAIEGVRVVPAMLTTQQGPDRHLGPEWAGAVLILQATLVDDEWAAAFWLCRAHGATGIRPWVYPPFQLC